MRMIDRSDRNYEIFCEVEFDGRSLRKTAEKYQISPTRVQQIVAEIRDWYRATAREWIEGCDPELQPLIACRMADERLKYLYGQSLDAWEDSRGTVTVQRESAAYGMNPTTTRVTAHSPGEPRYILLAARVSMMRVTAAERLTKIASKLPPVAPQPQVAPVAAEVVHEAPEITVVPQIAAAPVEPPGPVVAETPSAPPKIGCALSEPMSQETAPTAIEDKALTADDDSDCDAFDLALAAGASAVSDPVREASTKRQARKERRKAAREKRRRDG